jgi:hypothetical protein
MDCGRREVNDAALIWRSCTNWVRIADQLVSGGESDGSGS